MRDLKKQERTAIEAVARRFSATWEKGSDPPDAYIVVAGKRVAVDITTLKRRGTGQGNAAKPRLRFDKVAARLIERLQATLGETVPDGLTVRELLELVSAEAGRRAPRRAGDRWLAVISAGGISCLEAYRYIYSQLRMATDFKEILMVFGDGRVGMLTG